MKTKLQRGLFILATLFIVILIFAGVDYSIHTLNDAWSVPDFYFRNKIPFGFLWGIVGFLLSQRVQNIWIKALVVSGIVAVTLQVRYFLEGYNLSFVLLFLLVHFLILYPLSLGMFVVFKKYLKK